MNAATSGIFKIRRLASLGSTSATCISLCISFTPMPAAAQQITQGGGNGASALLFNEGRGGKGGIAGGGGGGGDSIFGLLAGGDGGSAAQTPSGVAMPGADGETGPEGAGGAGGAAGATVASGGGGGGGAGSYDPLYAGDGGAGGSGGTGFDLADTGFVELPAHVVGQAGQHGSTGPSLNSNRGGGGGGAGGMVFVSPGVALTTNGYTVTGGAGGEWGNAGGGGAGLVLLESDSITVTSGTGGTSAITGGKGGDGYMAGDGGAGLFLYNGGVLSHLAGTIMGGAGGEGANSGRGGAGVLSNLGTIDNQASIVGGTGGERFAGQNLTGSALGGSGLEVWGGTIVNAPSGVITGGAGGAQTGTSATYKAGDGGAGILFRNGQAANLTNAGTVAGGDGGTAVSGVEFGIGGVGIVGAASGNVTIVNSGTIRGGLAGDGLTRTDAVSLAGSNNRFEIRSGSSTIGNVVVAPGGTNNVLALGGASPGTVEISNVVSMATAGATNQYAGFTTFEKAGSSTWTLTGAGSQNWTILEGVLRGNSSSMAGNLTFATGAGSRAVEFNQAANGTYSGMISGDGGLIKSSAGILTVTGAGANSGGITISGGTLQVGNGGTTGTLGTGQITNNAALAFNRSNTLTVSNTISGGGTVTQAGSGITILTGDNTSHSGTTTISNGTLQLGNGGTSGTLGSGDVFNYGALVFNRSDVVTIANTIYRDGTVTQAGSGTTILTGYNFYSGTTTISAGTLQIGNGGSTGTLGTGDVINNGVLAYNRNASTASVLDNDISGTGALRFNSGSAYLTGSNSYLGGTSIAAGATVYLGDNRTTGNLGSGAVTNDGGLVLNRRDEHIVGNAILGSGTLTQAGSGTSILTGGNTYSGVTTIGNGTLQIGNGGAIGTLGSGAVANNAALVFNRSDAVTVANAISGSGTVTQTGSGTTTLSGISTYEGNTEVKDGTLIVNGRLERSAVVNVGSGASLAGSGTINGPVDVASSGTLFGSFGQGLTMGSLNFVSGSNLSIGSLSAVGTDNAVFDVTGNLHLDGNLFLNPSSLGYGTYTLFDVGGTLTEDGLYFASAPAGWDRSQFAVMTGGRFVRLIVSESPNDQHWLGGNGTWDGTTHWRIGGGILHAEWLGKNASFEGTSGTVEVVGQRAFSNIRFLSDGYRLTEGVSGQLVISGSEGAVFVNGGASATLEVPITGNGKLVKAGGGVLELSDNNTYTGGTVISGTLKASADANLGAPTGDITFSNGGLLLGSSFDLAAGRRLVMDAGGAAIDTNGHDMTVHSAMTGNANFTKDGLGALTLRGPSDFTGRTAINRGTLVANADSIGKGVIENSSELVIDQAMGGAMAQAIEGAGSLVKRGAGRLNLTGTSTLTGETFVRAGNLAVNGSLGSSSVNVEAGGTLSGTGTVGGINAARTGIVAPGNSIGTLHVAGSVTFSPGSFYDVEINGAGQSDRIAARGIATLNGGTVRIFADQGQYSLAPYTILTADGGVTGQFAGTEAGADFAFVTPTLGYGTDAVTLTLVRKVDPQPPVPPRPDIPTPPAPAPLAFHSVAATPNQYSTADGVEALGAGNRLFDAVIGASAAGARQAFDALSGEAHASASGTAFIDMLRLQDTILNRLRNGSLAQAGDMVPPTFDQRSFALWGRGFGSWGQVRGNGNAASLGTSTGGFILGAEAKVSDASRIGVAGGFTSTSFDLNGRLSSGTNEAVFGSIYGAAKWDAINVRLGALYAHHEVDVKRTIAFPGFSDQVNSSYDGSSLMAFGEVGYAFDLGGLALEPFLGASVMRLHLNGFQEEGGAAALTGYGRTYDLGTTTLGLRAEATLDREFPLTVHGMVGWRHAFGDVNPSALLAFSGGVSAFNVAGLPIDRDAFVAEAGLDWQVAKDTTLGVSYAGQIGERAQVHEVKGGFNWRFETR